MFLFFYGNNEFLLEKKLRELKDRYRAKAGGDLNLITFEGENFNCEDFLTQSQIVPLLATSRLIIVNNIFSCKNRKSLDKVKDFLNKIPETTIVIFTHIGNIDKRLGLYKALVASKNAHEFKPMDYKQQISYAKAEVERLGSTITDDALKELVNYCQGDLFTLSNEIDKLSLYRYGQKIELSDIESMVRRAVLSDVFKMIDQLSRGERLSALKELDRLLANGEPGLRIVAMVNYQYRLIAQIKEAQEKANNPFQASKIAGVSYFQASKVFDIAKKISWRDLYNKYTQIMAFDESIKTGKINEEEGIKELVVKL